MTKGSGSERTRHPGRLPVTYQNVFQVEIQGTEPNTHVSVIQVKDKASTSIELRSRTPSAGLTSKEGSMNANRAYKTQARVSLSESKELTSNFLFSAMPLSTSSAEFNE